MHASQRHATLAAEERQDRTCWQAKRGSPVACSQGSGCSSTQTSKQQRTGTQCQHTWQAELVRLRVSLDGRQYCTTSRAAPCGGRRPDPLSMTDATSSSDMLQCRAAAVKPMPAVSTFLTMAALQLPAAVQAAAPMLPCGHGEAGRHDPTAACIRQSQGFSTWVCMQLQGVLTHT
jgi:hypothetical protein